MLKASRASLWLAGTLSVLAVAGCSAPTINGFNLTAGPGNITISPGGTATINIASSSTGSAASTATVVLYNLPSGVSFAPSSPTIATGTQSTITLIASPNAPAATSQVSVSAYAGLAYSGAYVTVTVVPNP